MGALLSDGAVILVCVRESEIPVPEKAKLHKIVEIVID